MSVNKIILVGRVGQDPEIRTTKTGKEIANFSLATSKSYKDSNGEKQTKTQWHRVSVYGGLVGIVKNYVKKGSKLYLEGEMEYGEYEKDGHKVYTATVILSGFNSTLQMLDSKNSEPSQNEAVPVIPIDDTVDMVDNGEDSIPF